MSAQDSSQKLLLTLASSLKKRPASAKHPSHTRREYEAIEQENRQLKAEVHDLTLELKKVEVALRREIERSNEYAKCLHDIAESTIPSDLARQNVKKKAKESVMRACKQAEDDARKWKGIAQEMTKLNLEMEATIETLEHRYGEAKEELEHRIEPDLVLNELAHLQEENRRLSSLARTGGNGKERVRELEMEMETLREQVRSLTQQLQKKGKGAGQKKVVKKKGQRGPASYKAKAESSPFKDAREGQNGQEERVNERQEKEEKGKIPIDRSSRRNVFKEAPSSDSNSEYDGEDYAQPFSGRPSQAGSSYDLYKKREGEGGRRGRRYDVDHDGGRRHPHFDQREHDEGREREVGKAQARAGRREDGSSFSSEEEEERRRTEGAHFRNLASTDRPRQSKKPLPKRGGSASSLKSSNMSSIDRYSVEEVKEFFAKIGIGSEYDRALDRHEVSGRKLMRVSRDFLRSDLSMKTGHIKTLEQEMASRSVSFSGFE